MIAPIIRFLNRKSIALYRNQLGYKTNFYYLAYSKYSRLKSKTAYTKKDIAIAKTIKDEGIGVLGVSNVDEMSQLVHDVFKDIPVVNGYAQFPRSKNSLIAPHIYRVLMEHAGVIEAVFGSNFRVNWFECQKISSEGKQPDGSSFSYHTDDTPSQILKVFIYLTDTYEDNAAFRAFSYEVTDDLIKKGILVTSSPGEKRESAQHLVDKELEKKLKIIEGVKGTVFIFDNNLIHKGTMPRRGYRIHVSMEIMPYFKPLTYEDFSKNCNNEIEEYFPMQPFSLLKSEAK